MDLKALIRTIPDFPKPGIQFRDIESITENPAAFHFVIEKFTELIKHNNVDKIVALDARGFLFGAALALHQKLPLVMARKEGKLAGECVSEGYALEYANAKLELQKTAIKKGDQVMIIDDLLATGGTAHAAASLVGKLGGVTSIFAFVIELEGLAGRDRLGNENVVSLVRYC